MGNMDMIKYIVYIHKHLKEQNYHLKKPQQRLIMGTSYPCSVFLFCLIYCYFVPKSQCQPKCSLVTPALFRVFVQVWLYWSCNFLTTCLCRGTFMCCSGFSFHGLCFGKLTRPPCLPPNSTSLYGFYQLFTMASLYEWMIGWLFQLTILP